MSKRTASIDALVLGTVNAPYKREIDVRALSVCLRHGDMSPWLVHLATFFTDVSPALVLRFAHAHDISISDLRRSYIDIKTRTGERNPSFEAVIDAVADAA
jgi:hypothetical protein